MTIKEFIGHLERYRNDERDIEFHIVKRLEKHTTLIINSNYLYISEAFKSSKDIKSIYIIKPILRINLE